MRYIIRDHIPQALSTTSETNTHLTWSIWSISSQSAIHSASPVSWVRLACLLPVKTPHVNCWLGIHTSCQRYKKRLSIFMSLGTRKPYLILWEPNGLPSPSWPIMELLKPCRIPLFTVSHIRWCHANGTSIYLPWFKLSEYVIMTSHQQKEILIPKWDLIVKCKRYAASYQMAMWKIKDPDLFLSFGFPLSFRLCRSNMSPFKGKVFQHFKICG